MNTMLKITTGLIVLCLAQISHAQATTTVITPPQPTTWVSKSSYDTITINNGSGNRLTITITVDKPVNANEEPNNPVTYPGIKVYNCGDTRHIDAGSSGVCTTSDPVNPVNFSSDSATEPVSGSYVINQK